MTTYYNLWRIDSNRWTNAGYRMFNDFARYQDPLCPFLLTLQECEEWLNNFHETDRPFFQVRPIPPKELQFRQADIAQADQRLDQQRRQDYAAKYL